MAKGKVVASRVVDDVKKLRKDGMMLYVDKDGSVRATKMNRKGGKRGRKVCRK